MRNFLLTICIISFLYSCSSDEKPYIEQWMQDALGTDEKGKIGSIDWNDSTFYSMIGIKDKKLCIGFFKDKNYSDPVFVWTSPEPFPATCEINYGYDKKKIYKVKPYQVYLNVADQNNFYGAIEWLGSPIDIDKENTQGSDMFYYVFWVIEGKYKLINEPLTAANILFYSPVRWYDNSVAIHGILYTKDGKEFPLHHDLKGLIPINLFEGITTQTNSIKRKNILTGESVWELQINEDIEIDLNEKHPPISSTTITNKNGNKWEFQMDITFYNGDKKKRIFVVDIETGELERKSSVDN